MGRQLGTLQGIELTGSKSKIVFLPLPKDDPLQRKPNIELAKEVLGWEPKVCASLYCVRVRVRACDELFDMSPVQMS